MKHKREPRLKAIVRGWIEQRPVAKPRTRILIVHHDHRLAQTQVHPFRRYARYFRENGFEFDYMPVDRAIGHSDFPAADAVFVQSDYVMPPGSIETLLSRIRASNPAATISYFDWFAPTDVRLAARIEPYVDYYVKKSLLRDRDAYAVPTIGHTNLTDHYAAHYGTDNPPRDWDVPPSIIPRLRVGPSFSTGEDLIGGFEATRPTFAIDRPIDLHARLATKGTPWYQLMREQADAAAKAIQGAHVLTGMTSKKLYSQEMAQAKICFSPFGYGEICWRDFEAIAAGAVLLKPDMAHIECDPDIYVADETYVPVKWDFSDLAEQVHALLADPARMERIRWSAYAVVHRHLRDDSLLDLVRGLAKPPSRYAAIA